MSTMRFALLIFGCSTMMHLLDAGKNRRKTYQTASGVYKGTGSFDIEFMKDACSTLGDWVPARIENEANNDKATAACKEGSKQLCLIDIYRTYFGDSSHWYHIDDIHSAVNYFNWDVTQSQPGTYEACVTLFSDTGLWHDYPCDHGLSVLCMPRDEYPERTQLPYGTSKYKAANGRFGGSIAFDGSAPASHVQFVKDACSSLEGDYVTARIDTEEDNVQATDACRASGYETCLLGFWRYSLSEATKTWPIMDDGYNRDGPSYFNWEGGQYGTVGRCVALFSTTGEWQDVPCDQGSYGVLCLPESKYPLRASLCQSRIWQQVYIENQFKYLPSPCKCQAAGTCSDPLGFDSWAWSIEPDRPFYDTDMNPCWNDDSQTCCCDSELEDYAPAAISAPINVDEPFQRHVDEPKVDNDWNFVISIVISVFVPICILGCSFWCWFAYRHHSAKVTVDFGV